MKFDKLLTIALAALMGVSSVPSFAANEVTVTTISAARILSNYRIYQGDTLGNLMEDQKMTRGQAAVVLARLLGKEDEAKATDYLLGGFKDIKTNVWYAPYAAFAKQSGYMVGDYYGNFNPDSYISANEWAVMLQKVLKYKPVWSTILQDSTKLGIYDGVKVMTGSEQVLRGGNTASAAQMIVNALRKTPSGESSTLEEILGYVESGFFRVMQVSAPNLKQVNIRFNKELDKESAETESNYRVLDSSSALLSDGKGFEANLQSDGKTVTLTVEDGGKLANKAMNKISVAKELKDSVGEGLQADYSNPGLYLDDKTAPSVSSIETTAPNGMRVYFSEPVDNLLGLISGSDFKLDSGANGVNKEITVSGSGSYADITTVGSVEAGKHTLTVNKNDLGFFRDYAGNKLAKNDVSFSFTPVTTAPVGSIVSATPDSVIIKFDRAVKNLNLATIYHGYAVNAASQSNIDTYPVAGKSSVGSDTWKVVFGSDKLIPMGGAQVFIKGSKIAGSEVKDLWGNKLGDVALVANVDADLTPPKLESVRMLDKRRIEVKFSESVRAVDAENKSNYVFKSSSDKVMTSSSYAGFNAYGNPAGTASVKYTSSTRSALITFTSDLPLGSYKLFVKDVRDTVIYSENRMGEESSPIEVVNADAPRLMRAYASGGKVYLTFDKNMASSGDGSALNIASYYVDKTGTSGVFNLFSSGSTVSFGASAKDVVITLSNPSDITSASRIACNVSDDSGKSVSTIYNKASLSSSSPYIVSAITRDSDKDGRIDRMDVRFSSSVNASSILPGDITVDGYIVSAIEGVSSGLITIVLEEQGGTDTGKRPGLTISGIFPDQSATSDKTPFIPADGVAPVMVKVETNIQGASSVGTTSSKVRVYFSEDISDLQATEFILGSGANRLIGTSVQGSGATCVVTLGNQIGTPLPGASLFFVRSTARDSYGNAASNAVFSVSDIDYNAGL